jgi:hypothetical protein
MMNVNQTEEISPQEAKVLDRILEDIKNARPIPAEPQCSHGAVKCQVCGHRTTKGGVS